jgi:hypothetical protein
MKLIYPKWSNDIGEIEERFKSLSLQYNLSKEEDLSYPVLINGKSSYEGLPAIHAFIDQLRDEAPQWWYCNC